MINRIRIWDLPTRFFHWLLVVSFAIAWLTEGDAQCLDFHIFAGYVFASLLLFRILWGIIGSHYARFSQFVFGIKAVTNYLRSLFSPHPTHFVGHNPAGSWAIFGILILGLIITVSGLFTLGGQEQQGILTGVIGFEYGEIFGKIHNVSAWSLLGLVVIHVSGVIISSFLHHENLVRSMITGYKAIDTEGKSVALHGMIAVLLIISLLVGSGFYFQGYFTQTPDNPYLPFTIPPLSSNATWLAECSDCHLAYHPSLLPARSWQRLFNEQAEHFGDDLALDEDTVTELTTFSDRHAAETQVTKIAWKMNLTIPINEVPLRVTETQYWEKRHKEIPEVIWQQTNISSKANCPACHLDAKQGAFQAGAMHIPSIAK